MYKFMRVFISCLVLASVVSGCGAGDSPEAVAEGWLEAVINYDQESWLDHSCATDR